MSISSQEMFRPVVVIFDVDGVMTDGNLYYSTEGKAMKVFGPDDNDALSLLKAFLPIRFVTGDRKGFSISKKRIVDDMKYDLDLVSTVRRAEWIAEFYDPSKVIYMGDGIFDHYVMKRVGYSVAPANSADEALRAANFVTKRSGGNRAVAEACLHIMEKFFTPFDFSALPVTSSKMSGEWTV